MELKPAVASPMFTNKALRQLIIPLILEQLLAMTVGLAAVVMITKVGEAAVSGVSLIDSLNILIISILSALCTGGAVVCAQYIGRQEPENARTSARQLVYISLIFALAVGVALLCAPRFFIRLIFGAVEASVAESARTYLIYSAISFPFLALYNSCAALFRAMGNSRVSLYVSIVMNVVNISLNALFIYGLHLGVLGVSIATATARIVAAVLMMMLIRSKSNVIYLTNLLPVRFEKNMVRSILSIGVPNGLENGMFNFGKLLVQTLVAWLGTSAIAANAIIGSIFNITIVPGMGLSLSILTVVGQCVGAGDYKQAVSYAKKLMVITYISMAAVNLPLLIFGKQVLGLFSLSDQAFEIACTVLPPLAISCCLFWPLSFAFPNVLRAAGDAKYTMVVSASTMWIVRFGLSWLLTKQFHLGLEGIWYCMMIDWIVRSVFFFLRYRSGAWRAKTVIR
ncbi:MAG: MATE family efflux transporter [Clostridiales bacterium]|nr:MATE family efflux transporter [Clostridiales bacterium]